VQNECGAVGDGKADDTAAVQKGLDLIRPEDSRRKILYFPAGTYRITGTIKAIREKHRECQGVGLQGEGPDQSVIVYDGAGNEPMLQWGAWYSTIRSLGFQPMAEKGISDMGYRISETNNLKTATISNIPSSISQSSTTSDRKAAKLPTAGIWFGPGFSTANEVSDCAFWDLPIGIQGGTDKTQGQAEVAVERCRFERCDFGLLLANWNSLDWWFWDCRFTECGTGVSNDPGCGEFRLYRCKLTGSKKADIQVGNLGTFAFVENVSRGSQMFFSANWGQTAGGNFTIQGNRIEGTTFSEKIAGKETPGLGIYLGNPGPVLMLDNQFVRKEAAMGPDVYFQSANSQDSKGAALLIGNTTTGSSLYEAEKNYEVRVIEDGDVSAGIRMKMRIKEAKDLQTAKPTNPAVVEIAAGASGDQIQAAMDGAKDGTVIHLPAGTYRLGQPLTVKTGKKVKLQGDGLLNATTLVPDGDFGERGLIEVQPGGRLEARDLALQAPIQGGGVVGMIVKTEDTDEVKVAGNQVQTTGFGPGLVVEGLDYGRVVLRNHGHNGVTVFGGPRLANGEPVPGRVEILCGASSRDKNLKPQTPIYDVRKGGKIMVRDVWYEGDPPEFMQVRDRGDIVFVGGHVAPNKGQDQSTIDAIQMNGKAGSVLLAQAALNGADLTIGKLAEGFFVTLFGLTPYPGTLIRYADQSSRRSDMGDGISEAEKLKPGTISISNIPSSISAKPGGPGFVQLMCRQNNTEITGSEPLPDVNADGDVAGRFKVLRDWKLPPADLDAPVQLHRVSCTGSIGLVIVSAGSGKSRSESK